MTSPGSERPADREQVVQLLLTGAGAGLLLGAFLTRLHLGRALPVGLRRPGAPRRPPYLTPFPSLQQSIPRLASLRFPRFFLIAPAGPALGAAYP